MKISQFFLATFLVAGAGTAQAGGQNGSIGVGTEFQLSGLGGPSLNIDGGKFHAGGFFAFEDPNGRSNTIFELGGRFFYHVHSTATTDFSLGGTLGLGNFQFPTGANTSAWDNFMFLEPGFQIRAFIATNVALSFNGGISIALMDANGTAITGQNFSFPSGNQIMVGGANVGLAGGAGIHYYFF
jgi:hypothetical protein